MVNFCSVTHSPYVKIHSKQNSLRYFRWSMFCFAKSMFGFVYTFWNKKKLHKFKIFIFVLGSLLVLHEDLLVICLIMIRFIGFIFENLITNESRSKIKRKILTNWLILSNGKKPYWPQISILNWHNKKLNKLKRNKSPFNQYHFFSKTFFALFLCWFLQYLSFTI